MKPREILRARFASSACAARLHCRIAETTRSEFAEREADELSSIVPRRDARPSNFENYGDTLLSARRNARRESISRVT